MRTEQEMFDLIFDVAKKDERIRAVYMNGSRTNPNVKKDIFQDYDIVYLVTETASFIKDEHWIDVFGEGLIIQLPDELDKMSGKEVYFDRCYGYLMQFTDGNRIDLHIETLGDVLEEYESDKLTITLLDKDNILPKIPEPSDVDYWVKKPTSDLFFRCCNEFHWVLLYIGKGLWRDEILYALDHLNEYVRPELFQMLKWYAGIQTEFSCSIGKNGKFLKQYLPEEPWKQYLKTYPEATVEAVWDATFVMTELFEEVATRISKEFGFEYNKKESHRCISYMKHIRELPKDATEII